MVLIHFKASKHRSLEGPLSRGPALSDASWELPEAADQGAGSCFFGDVWSDFLRFFYSFLIVFFVFLMFYLWFFRFFYIFLFFSFVGLCFFW